MIVIQLEGKWYSGMGMDLVWLVVNDGGIVGGYWDVIGNGGTGCTAN